MSLSYFYAPTRHNVRQFVCGTRDRQGTSIAGDCSLVVHQVGCHWLCQCCIGWVPLALPVLRWLGATGFASVTLVGCHWLCQCYVGWVPLALPVLHRLGATGFASVASVGCHWLCQCCVGWVPLALPVLHRLGATGFASVASVGCHWLCQCCIEAGTGRASGTQPTTHWSRLYSTRPSPSPLCRYTAQQRGVSHNWTSRTGNPLAAATSKISLAMFSAVGLSSIRYSGSPNC